MITSEKCWTTIDEMRVIDFIASDKPRKKESNKLTKADRKKRLSMYIKSYFNRVDWGVMNKRKCEQYAQELLSNI